MMPPPSDGTRHDEVLCLWVHPAGEWQVERDPGSLAIPRWESRAWFCPHCGEVWAREVMLDRGEVLGFLLVEGACARCGPVPQFAGVAGSLTLPTRNPTLTFETLPPELAAREADILLAVSLPKERGNA